MMLGEVKYSAKVVQRVAASAGIPTQGFWLKTPTLNQYSILKEEQRAEG